MLFYFLFPDLSVPGGSDGAPDSASAPENETGSDGGQFSFVSNLDLKLSQCSLKFWTTHLTSSKGSVLVPLTCGSKAKNSSDDWTRPGLTL